MNDIPQRILDAVERMVEAARAGKLGAYDPEEGCVYHDDNGRFCGIGCLFTPYTHEEIERECLNDGAGPSTVAEALWGETWFVAETGLTPEEAEAFQAIHDRTYGGPRETGDEAEIAELYIERLRGYLAGTWLEESAAFPMRPLRDVLRSEGAL